MYIIVHNILEILPFLSVTDFQDSTMLLIFFQVETPASWPVCFCFFNLKSMACRKCSGNSGCVFKCHG